MLVGALSLFLIDSILLITVLASLYGGYPSVLKITNTNFATLVERSTKPVLVEFYSPGCPHCVQLVQKWVAVADNLKGHVPVGAVNCQADPLCTRYEVQGVPSIKLFVKDAKGGTLFIDYNDERSVGKIVAFAERHVESLVVKVSESGKTGVTSLKDFLKQDSKLPHVLLFKSGKLAPAMSYKTLSVDYKGKLVLGISNMSIDTDMTEKLGVTLPSGKDALVLIKPGELKGTIYEGKLAFSSLKTYFDQLSSTHKQKTEL